MFALKDTQVLKNADYVKWFFRKHLLSSYSQTCKKVTEHKHKVITYVPYVAELQGLDRMFCWIRSWCELISALQGVNMWLSVIDWQTGSIFASSTC